MTFRCWSYCSEVFLPVFWPLFILPSSFFCIWYDCTVISWDMLQSSNGLIGFLCHYSCAISSHWDNYLSLRQFLRGRQSKCSQHKHAASNASSYLQQTFHFNGLLLFFCHQDGYLYSFVRGEIINSSDPQQTRYPKCIRSMANFSDAVSPAFLIDGECGMS